MTSELEGAVRLDVGESILGFLATRHRRPDVLLATGDLVNDGRPEQYRLRHRIAGRVRSI